MSWKRENIADHKFDYVDVDDFIDNSWTRKLLYSSVFIYALKDILVYMADLGSAVLLLSSNYNVIFNKGGQGTIIFGPNFNTTADSTKPNSANAVIQALGGPLVLFSLIIASLIASFVLLIFEWRKANQIIKSRDISYAFTSEVAYSYYTIRSYPHYCFFSQIQNSRKPVDVLAFWVFFKFRGWKRLILAEFPRQFLNSLIVYGIFTSTSQQTKSRGFIALVQAIYQSQTLDTLVFLSLQLVTISIWVISFLGLVAAFIIYIPLLCNIRGNLKEYCVHKIDKRIDEILKRKTRKRLQDARRQEQERIGDGASSISGGGRGKGKPNSSSTLHTEKDQPTLPNISSIDLDNEDAYSSYSHSNHHTNTAQYYYSQGGYADYDGYVNSEVGSSVYQPTGYYQTQPMENVPQVPGPYVYQEQYGNGRRYG